MISKVVDSVIKKQFIKNVNLPSCSECMFYVQGKLKSGICTKFGEKDLITGKITHQNVLITRFDENLCSMKGHYFEKK